MTSGNDLDDPDIPAIVAERSESCNDVEHAFVSALSLTTVFRNTMEALEHISKASDLLLTRSGLFELLNIGAHFSLIPGGLQRSPHQYNPQSQGRSLR